MRPGFEMAAAMQTRKIEDYRPGYPRFTALLSAHNPYFLCRPFNKIRARLLLLKQDQLSRLEQRLEEIDHEEVSPLFLGTSRGDRNKERISILSNIEFYLADYDQFVERTSRILSFGPAQKRDVESLQNWLDGTGCIARDETAYLEHHQELVNLGPARDSAVLRLEIWVEDKLIQWWPGFRERSFHDVSNDSNVYIYSGQLVQRTARAILLFTITLLLMMPVVICNIISTTSARIVVVLVSTIIYLLILSELTKSRTIELILAGATYATVLIVFVSGTTNDYKLGTQVE